MSYKFDKAKYIKFAKKCFKVINGKINTALKAKEIKVLDKKKIILKDEIDSVTIATASCNVIYFDIRTLEYLCTKVEAGDFQIKSLIIHFIAHELSHLDQIMADDGTDDDLLNLEIANELNTIKFLYKNKEYLTRNLCDFDMGGIYISDDREFKRMNQSGVISYSKYIIGMKVEDAVKKFPYIKAKNSLEKFNDDAKVFLGKIDLHKAYEENVKFVDLVVDNQYRDYKKAYKIDLEELFNSDNDTMDDIIENLYTFIEDELFVGYTWTGYIIWDKDTQSIWCQYEVNGKAKDGYVSNFDFLVQNDDEFGPMYIRMISE